MIFARVERALGDVHAIRPSGIPCGIRLTRSGEEVYLFVLLHFYFYADGGGWIWKRHTRIFNSHIIFFSIHYCTKRTSNRGKIPCVTESNGIHIIIIISEKRPSKLCAPGEESLRYYFHID
jgi:hypothetical protein